MSNLQLGLYSVGALIVFGVLVDVFITVFSTNGVGPITGLWTRWMWRTLLFVHRRRRIHGVLAFAGPFMLLATIAVWYVLMGSGTFLVFAAHPFSVENSSTGQPADWIEKIYFVNTTISGLGYGDFVPSRLPWTLLATTGAFTTTLLITASISYVIAIVAAAIERRKLAQSIFALGEDVSEIIRFSHLDEPGNSLQSYVTGIAGTIDNHALKHLAYPILKYFHHAQADASPMRAILLLSDALFILGLGCTERSPPAGVQRLVESSIRNYANITGMVMPVRASTRAPQHLLAKARECGIAVDRDDLFHTTLDSYLPLRHRLLALCHEDGWYEQ